MYRMSILLLLALAACSTPQERCVANATKDLRTLDGLIGITRGNINRGYAIVTRESLTTESRLCGVVNGEEVYCDVAVPTSQEVPTAINLDAEQAKLASLVKKRKELSARSEAVIRDCRIRHPE